MSREREESPRSVYSSLLLSKVEGYPLWVPEPDESLPEEYRSHGISIGDVGIVSDEGLFDFLFNICRPADDLVNRGQVPADFQPVAMGEIYKTSPFTSGEMVANSVRSNETDRTSNGNSSLHAGVESGFRFETSSYKGAMLAFPEGASREGLKSVNDFRPHAVKNATKWYQYAYHERRRDIHNGSLCLVTGWDKTTSWGLAAFYNASGDSNVSMNLTISQDESNGRRTYQWQHDSSVVSRVHHPDLPPLRNQCVVLRGFRISVRDDVLTRLRTGFKLSVDGTTETKPDDFIMGERDAPRGVGLFSRFRGLFAGDLLGNQPQTADGNLPASDAEAFVRSNVTVEPLSNYLESHHPSVAINKYLLETLVDAHGAVTHDEDWLAALHGVDVASLEVEDLLCQLTSTHVFKLQAGVAFLQSKDSLTPSMNHDDPMLVAGKSSPRSPPTFFQPSSISVPTAHPVQQCDSESPSDYGDDSDDAGESSEQAPRTTPTLPAIPTPNTPVHVQNRDQPTIGLSIITSDVSGTPMTSSPGHIAPDSPSDRSRQLAQIPTPTPSQSDTMLSSHPSESPTCESVPLDRSTDRCLFQTPAKDLPNAAPDTTTRIPETSANAPNGGQVAEVPFLSRNGSAGPRIRPRLPVGPRKPSHLSGSPSVTNAELTGGGATGRRKAERLTVTSAPRFYVPPPKWRGHTADAANWTFTPEQMQGIISRAFIQSAEASAIRLLRLEMLDQDVPDEMHRLEMLAMDLKTRYKFAATKRQTLLSSLFVRAGGNSKQRKPPAAGLQMVEELVDTFETLDHLTAELHSINVQMSQLQSLRDVHLRSALSMALRKLNSSFLMEAAETQILRSRVEALEFERDDAWRRAKDIAMEFDNLHDKLLDEGYPPPASNAVKGTDSHHPSNRVSTKRQSWARASRSGLYPPNMFVSDEAIPPVPPIPSNHGSLGILARADWSSGNSMGLTPSSPTSDLWAMQKAQQELYEMLGISPLEQIDVRRRAHSMSGSLGLDSGLWYTLRQRPISSATLGG